MRHKLGLAAAASSLTLLVALAAVPAASAATLLSDDFGDGDSTGWTDQAVQARVRPIAFNGANRHAAVLARAQSTSNYYYLAVTDSGSAVLGKRVVGGFTPLASAPASVPAGTWAILRLEAFGTTLRGFLGDVQVVTATDSTVSNHYAGPAGRCVARDNAFTGESGQPDCSGAVEEPRTYYNYVLDDPSTVKAAVVAGAGVGKIGS